MSLEDGVCEDQELPGACDESQFVGFSGGGEALIEADEGWVPFEGGRQGRGVEAAAQPASSALDMLLTDALAGSVVEGRQAGEAVYITPTCIS